MKEFTQRLLILVSFFFGQGSFAQKESNVWYFGSNAGVDFNSGAPAELLNGQMNTSEGCASISDSLGNLLFYTDGITVWNRKHFKMPNGGDLYGHPSSTQSALIVQKPGSASTYYIFTETAEAEAAGLRYSEVDLSLDGGLGDVINKNIYLQSPSCEKLAGVRHSNGRDTWVVTHDWNSNVFRTFLVSGCGVDPQPVLSSCGELATGHIGNVIGQLKGSPDGTKLASAMEFTSRFELFDFNNSNGQVSNPLLFPQLSKLCYAVEFSPDNKKLYAVTASPSHIYQFDLSAGSASSIVESGVKIATIPSNSDLLYGSLQAGPDKKIYVSIDKQFWLGVINDPNKLNSSCNYKAQGFPLTKRCRFGLPNCIMSNTKPALPFFNVKVNCLEASFTLPVPNDINAALSVNWNFGDSFSGQNNISGKLEPTHVFSAAGNYTVSLVIHYKCRDEIIKQNVTIDKQAALVTEISGENSFCLDQDPVFAATTIGTYLWNTGDTTRSIKALAITKSYSVTVTTSAGCTYTASKSVKAFPLPTVSVESHPVNEFTSRLTATGGLLYNWSPPEGLSCTSCPDPTAIHGGSASYCVKVTDKNGCSAISCIKLKVSSAYIPNTFSPNEDN